MNQLDLTPSELREQAMAIWQAGIESVRSDRLVREAVRISQDQLIVGDLHLPLQKIGRIAIVGCGKAGTGMAAGLEDALGPKLLREKQVTGWVNVPGGCERPLGHVHLHPARPAGVNEPTAAGVAGATRILEIVSSLAPNDVCFCLISGGGSALLPSPVAEITLDDKLAVTKHLSAAGANIQQLNTVRKQLSRIKGGGLARACNGGYLISLIISDVLGDPLDVIASGPTVPDTATPIEALSVLNQFGARDAGVSETVFQVLRTAAAHQADPLPKPSCETHNLVIGNNATAVEASAAEARHRGFDTSFHAETDLEGEAEAIGVELAQRAIAMKGGRCCFISGGEPVVRLVPSAQRGRGGRNQQLVLAAIDHLRHQRVAADCSRICLVSGGTDGEDGPTDAAGAFADAMVYQQMEKARLQPEQYLSRNDAYRFFESTGGLLKTGPTDTNVCDLRVVLTT